MYRFVVQLGTKRVSILELNLHETIIFLFIFQLTLSLFGGCILLTDFQRGRTEILGLLLIDLNKYFL